LAVDFATAAAAFLAAADLLGEPIDEANEVKSGGQSTEIP